MHINLKYKNYEAGIDPFGACLTYFRYHHLNILRPRQDVTAQSIEENSLDSACFPCVPYFGRIKHPLQIEDKSFALSTTNKIADHTHAIHGEGWVNQWTITHKDQQSLILTYHSDGNDRGRYPVAWKAEQKFLLSDEGLNIQMSVSHRHKGTMPVGLGLHPFFLRKPGTHLEFSHQDFITPPGLKEIPLAPGYFDIPTPLPDYPIDHSVSGWNGAIIISYTDKYQPIRLKSNAPYLHIYAPEKKDYFCLEPITQLPGAFDKKKALAKIMTKPDGVKRLDMLIQPIEIEQEHAR